MEVFIFIAAVALGFSIAGHVAHDVMKAGEAFRRGREAKWKHDEEKPKRKTSDVLETNDGDVLDVVDEDTASDSLTLNDLLNTQSTDPEK